MWVAGYLVIAEIAGVVDGVEVVSVGQEVILVPRHCRVWQGNTVVYMKVWELFTSAFHWNKEKIYMNRQFLFSILIAYCRILNSLSVQLQFLIHT